MAPLTLSDIPSLTSLYKLGRLAPATTASSFKPSPAYNAKISHIQHDITKLELGCIVNAANESLMGGGGVDGAIHRAAGPKLARECEKLDGCDTGNAKITKAYELPCRAIVHAVGPVYSYTKRRGMHETLLRGCYRKSLELAERHKLGSIAFSALSTGVYGYPSSEAAETAISEVRKFLDEGHGEQLERIVFCNFADKDVNAYNKFLPQFFPPTKDELKKEAGEAVAETEETGTEAESKEDETAKAVTEESKLPDAPTAEPVTEQDGSPLKKQKLEHTATNDDESDAVAEDSARTRETSGSKAESKV